MKSTAARSPSQWPLAIDLFSGSGGVTLGLRQARFKVVGAVENDPLSLETYAANHKRPRLWATDIRLLPAAQALREVGLQPGQLDLLAGCPPCQGFSSLRTLNQSRRIRDDRNNLLFEFLRFASVMKPRTVMFENVPGLTKHDIFGEFVEKLGLLGYHITSGIVDAADFGVPQRRRRLLLFGSKAGPIPLSPPAGDRTTVAHAIRDLGEPGTSGDPLHDQVEKRSARIKSMIASIPADGGSRTDLPDELQLECHKRSDGFKDVYGRMAWEAVAPTITGGCVNPSKGRFLHPVENRAITLREAALLQSFPPDYFFSLSKGKLAAAELIGNAFPPELVRRHAKQIRDALAA